MKHLVLTLSAMVFAAIAQPTPPVAGTISGNLKGEDGSSIVGATIYLHRTPPSVSKIAPSRTNWEAVTSTGGAFRLNALPPGTYTLCPRLANSIWLDPCEWSLPTPSVTVSSLTLNPSITITLKLGAAVPIRIEDGGQILTHNKGVTGAGLLLGISSPGYFFRLIPLVSEDSNGRNYQIVVPFNTQLTLAIHPSLFELNDGAGHALGSGVSTKVPIFIQTGQQSVPIRFSVTGIGGGH